jgi:hypothetical protein
MTDISNKKRAMTDKRFATAKLSGKTTAEGFLAAHMSFLRNHTFLEPILDAYQEGVVLPTPTLQAVQSALLTHVLESERLTEEQKILARQEKAHTRKSKLPKGESFGEDEEQGHSKSYTVTLFVNISDPERFSGVEVGTIEEITGYKIRTSEGDKVVATKEEADGHAILETIKESEPAVWEIDGFGKAMGLADRRLFAREDAAYCEIVNNFDTPITTKVMRGDAIARILKSKKGAVSRVRGRSTKTLGFQPHAKQTRVTGPWLHR